MVDVASIVVAIIALVGTLATGAATFFLQRSKDKYTRSQAEATSRAESLRLIRKYNDPLARAASDLQSRLYNICDNYFLEKYAGRERLPVVIPYTAYLVGQYLTWEHILRVQAQFVGFDSISGESRDLNILLGRITDIFSEASSPWNHSAYKLWRCELSAISEIMTVREVKTTGDPELLCMGFAAFMQKWNGVNTTETEKSHSKDEIRFRDWFIPIIDGTYKLTESFREGEHEQREPRFTSRLRCLQHLLLDLTKMLDTKQAVYRDWFGRCEMNDYERDACQCTACKDHVRQRKVKPEHSSSQRQEKPRAKSPSLVDEEPKDRQGGSSMV